MADAVQDVADPAAIAQSADAALANQAAPAQPDVQSQGPDTVDPKAVGAAADRVEAAGASHGFWSFLQSDNYDTRDKQLAQELSNGTPAYQQAVAAEVYKRDSDAFSPSRINRLADHGDISQTSRSNIAEALAGAYNAGEIPSYSVPVADDPANKRTASPLDNPVQRYDIRGPDDAVNNAAQAKNFVDLMNSSTGPQATEFKEKYAKHLIDDYVLKRGADPMQSQAAAGIAAGLLTGDPSRPNLVSDTLQPYSKEDLNKFLNNVAASNGLFGKEVLKSRAAEQYKNLNDVATPDGLAALYNSVARDSQRNGDPTALRLVQYAADNPDRFKGGGVQSNRADALGKMFYQHSASILGNLSTFDNNAASTLDDPSNMKRDDAAKTLSGLFSLTLANPNSTNKDLVESGVTSYIHGLQSQYRTDQAHTSSNSDITNRIAMVAASVTHSVQQGFQQAKDDLEARKALIGQLVDFAVAAVPYGTKAGDALKGTLKDLLGESKASTLLQNLGGSIIDKSTGKVNEAAKDAIVKALGPDIGNLTEMQGRMNNFVANTFLNALRGQTDAGRTGSENAYQDFQLSYGLILQELRKH